MVPRRVFSLVTDGTFNNDYWTKNKAGTLTDDEKDNLDKRIDTPQSEDIPYLDTWSTDT